MYQMDLTDEPTLRLVSSYADHVVDGHRKSFRLGEGLIGQCAVNMRPVLITNVEGAVPITSALMELTPKNIIVLPVVFESEVKAVIELSSLTSFTELSSPSSNSSPPISVSSSTASKPRCRQKAC